MDTSSQQPLFDAEAGSADGSIPQVDFTPAGLALDANSAPIGTAGAFGGSSFGSVFSSVPGWAWALLIGVVALKVTRVI